MHFMGSCAISSLEPSFLVVCICDQTHVANPEVPLPAWKARVLAQQKPAEASVLSLRLGPRWSYHVPRG